MADMHEKFSIKQYLLDVLGDGITGLAVISKDGFVIESVGELSSRDVGLSSVFSIAIPKMVDEINEKYVSKLNMLLDERAKLDSIHISGFSFKLGERQFLSIHIADFTFIASVRQGFELSQGFRLLLSVIPKVLDSFSGLSGRKLSPFILAIPEQRSIEQREVSAPVTSLTNEKKIESLRIFVLKVRELVFDIKKSLIEHGDWNTTLQGFRRFKEKLDELNEIAPEIMEHPAIKAIDSWVNKTIERIESILETHGNERIDEERKNVLRRGLSKAVEYIRFVISKELEGH